MWPCVVVWWVLLDHPLYMVCRLNKKCVQFYNRFDLVVVLSTFLPVLACVRFVDHANLYFIYHLLTSKPGVVHFFSLACVPTTLVLTEFLHGIEPRSWFAFPVTVRTDAPLCVEPIQYALWFPFTPHIVNGLILT
jgi:hypothetical protein